MIDHLLGRPSPSWKRLQVFLVVFFWIWRILHGNAGGPRVLWIRRVNRALQRFTPWQIVVSTLTGVYAVRNLDKILGLGSPEPLANLYSPNYYRATWISTGLDAGFATAMSIRPKWVRDICSILFSIYYIIYATEADEKLRRFRAVPTVEMLRTTWEKITNPYLRAIARYPNISIRRKLLLPRPPDSTYQRPITAWLFFAPAEHHLSRATELILDFPGGGFISMTPEHHEDRLRMWAVRTGKPVLSIEYGKAPEYPYPYAIDECFDAYRTLCESAGRIIGMSGVRMNTIFTGDSAGAHIAVAVMIKILETQLPVPHPLALQLNYAALDFNFTSWMSPANLRVLQSEQSTGHLSGLVEQKDHFKHVSPLSMVGDRKVLRRRRSWRDALRQLTSPVQERPPLHTRASIPLMRATKSGPPAIGTAKANGHAMNGNHVSPRNITDEAGTLADAEDDDDLKNLPEEEKPIQARVRFHPINNLVEPAKTEEDRERKVDEDAGGGPSETSTSEAATRYPEPQPLVAQAITPLGTRLTMTSRTGYFQDRIISPSMMRAMAILFIGPHRNPDFASDYHLSPVLAPAYLLAQFPPLLMTCGEKDPFVDDTVIFAGRVRDAKRARRKELEAAIAGKSVKFGEHLRMTLRETGGGGRDDATLRAMKRELSELSSQTEEDWVRMHIFTDWSHGYMQMARLMHEARQVIDDLADWMDSVFIGQRGRGRPVANHNTQPAPTWRQRRVPPTTTTHAEEGATPLTSETELETETDDLLTFSPKKKPQSPRRSFTGTREKAGARARSGSRTPSLASRTAYTGGSDDAGIDSAAAALTKAGAHHPHSSYLSPNVLHGTDSMDHQGLAGNNGASGQSGAASHQLHLPSPAGGPQLGGPVKVGSPGKAGQTITESELMRRRRLLDSHLLPNDSTKGATDSSA